MVGLLSVCHCIPKFAGTYSHGGRDGTSPFAQAMLGTIMEQSMLHLLHCFLFVPHVLCSTTLAVCGFDCFWGSRFGVFDVGRFCNHAASLDLSAFGDHVSCSFHDLIMERHSFHSLLLYSWWTNLCLYSWRQKSAETVVYINIRVQREGLNKGVLEGELYGDRSIIATKYSLVDRVDVEVV